MFVGAAGAPRTSSAHVVQVAKRFTIVLVKQAMDKTTPFEPSKKNFNKLEKCK
jgi:hypothetical protein